VGRKKKRGGYDLIMVKTKKRAALRENEGDVEREETFDGG